MELAKSVASFYGSVKPDLTWDGTRIPLDPTSVDSGMATEVLEHCPEPAVVLQEIHRVLRPGGVFFMTVPFLWPLHDVPHDEYRYTPFALDRLLRQAGFNERIIKPLGGWDASLAQMLGLWVTQRPMPLWKRRIMRRLSLPVVKWLLKHDHVPDPRSSPMITGLWALVVK
jgi:SAM-dependent methyltransferase